MVYFIPTFLAISVLACLSASRVTAEEVPTVPFVQAAPASEEWQPTQEQIREIQVRLKTLGFDLGKADGVPGPKTRAAIQAYQRSVNVVADGKLTKDVYDRLTGQTVKTEEPIATPPELSTPQQPQTTEKQTTCWDIEDAGGGSIELALLGDGSVIGPPYPRHWRWQPTDRGISIMYDNGMGLTVARTGVMQGKQKIVGNAEDSRGRSWTWTAEQLATDCPPQ